ncbi:unnamed protein product [Taenia asiatica]|uniref:Ig-like domain-containing protein n=1 Tax=Taenia asiatica TaxID=60517 RepID=A0A158R8K4_TAEAS|nr:unnamed protein product [Taenia asiatica]
MKDTDLKESQIGALSELDSEITDFVEKLNMKTQFVVSCFTYFRVQDELLETVRNALLHISTRPFPDNANISLEALNNDFQNLRKLAASILGNIERVPEMLVIPTIFSNLNYFSLIFQFVRHLNGLAQTYIVSMNPSTIDDADRALQSIETAKSLADTEWRKLESRVGLVDDGDVAARHYNIWSSQLTEKRENVLQRKRLLSRTSELEHDFSAYSRKLDQLIDAACCPSGDDFSKDYLRRLEAINSEVMCLRNTVPAQEELMEAFNNDVKTIFNAETPTDVSKVQQVWSGYVQELCKFESILPTLMQNSQLLAAARGFTSSLQSKFGGIIQDSEALREIQQEAAKLQEDIEHHLNSITNPLDPIFHKSSVYWLVEGLQSALGTLQEVGEEAEIMATNLNDHVNRMKSSESPNLDYSPSLHRNGPYDDHEEHRNSSDSQQSSWKSRANASGFENDASFNEDDIYFSKQSDVMNATPGGSITIHCTFHGFDEEPIVKWSFVPAHRPPDTDEFVESFLDSTTIPRNDAKNASLLIPNVLYKHAGQYIVTITHPQTSKQITSSCKYLPTDNYFLAKLYVKPKLKRGLTDVSAIVDGNKCTVTGREVAFFLEYGGFDKVPSRVVWLHNGRPIDPTKWAVSISPLTTRIKSDCLKSVDEGQYTCQVADDELDVKLESSGENALDVPRPASRSSSRTVTPSGNEKSLWITKALDSSPLSLKCPLPSVAFEAYSEARRVRMQWFRDGIQLYDSDWQTPDYFTGSQGVPFVDGNTFWSVNMLFPCNSGVITVCSSQQFVEQLAGLKVYLGEPAELRCRLEPWVTGTSPESRTTINWYHFETILTPELQDRVGIKTGCNDGLCTLRIEKTSRRFGGVYKCEAKNKFGVCITSCRLLIDRKTIITAKEESLLHIPSSLVEDNCIYAVVIKNVAGSAESSYTLHFNGISANVGESVVFSCVIRPSLGAPKIHRVSWRHKNRELKQGESEMSRVISSANIPCDGVFQLKLTNICESDHGDYEVSALDENDVEICSATFHLSVDDRKSFVEEGEKSPICDEVFLDSPRLPSRATVGAGERLEMTCYISGFPIPQVFWFKDGQQLSDRSSTNDFQLKKRGHVYQLIIPCALPHHAGLWEVIARNSAGLVMSGSNIEVRPTEQRSQTPSSLVPLDRRARSLSPRALTETSHRRLVRSHINEQAPQFTRLFRDQTASCGANVQFECTVIGLPTPDVRWEHNGEELQRSSVGRFEISNVGTVHKLVLKTVDPTFSGRYTLIAENPMGVAACSALLTVRSCSGSLLYPPTNAQNA